MRHGGTFICHGRTCRPERVPEYVLTLDSKPFTVEINCTARAKRGKLAGFFGKVGSEFRCDLSIVLLVENRITMNCRQDQNHTFEVVEMSQEGPWCLI